MINAEIAKEIAEYANQCCNRSDGYEEDVEKFAKCLIEEALNTCRENTIKEIQEGTLKVFGDGTKNPWKTLLDAARKEVARECAEIAKGHYEDHCCEDCPCSWWRENVSQAIKEKFDV